LKKVILIISILKTVITILAIKYFVSFRYLIKFLEKKRLSNQNFYDQNEIRLALNSVFTKFNIDNCLTSSSVIYVVLTKNGFKSKLSIGFHEKNKDFHSHSWVEYENNIYHTNPIDLKQIKKLIEIAP
tara:strand:- start:2 stop:385 length:384 start_codon:yes stop_codon:yes gene_type:complete